MISRPIQILFQRLKSSSNLFQLQSLIVKSGLDHEPYIISGLVLYSCSISMDFTRKFFDNLPIVPPLFAWNTIIRSYANSSNSVESIKLFSQLWRKGIKPDNFTFPFVLKACGICSMIQVGGAVHSVILKMGFDSDKYVGNTLLRMWASFSALSSARQVFDEMPVRDVASWSSMIAAYVACDCPLDALMVFRDMKKMNELPNSVTLVSLLSACSHLPSIRIGRLIHSYIVTNDIEQDVALGTVLVEMYSKCGDIEKALLVFYSMHEKNLQTWTIMISSLADHGRGEDAIDLFTKMVHTGLKPDSMSYSALLSACSHLGLIDDGRKYFDQMIEVYHIKPTIQHYGSMVDMLGRAGMITEAYDIIKKMPMKPNSVILRSLISSCRNHGKVLNVDEGIRELLLKMEPELGANYVLAASVSSISGSYDSAADLRVAMKRKYVKKTPGCSWV